jgi:hypothetical protein
MKQIFAPSNSTIEAPVEGVNRDPYREDSKRGNKFFPSVGGRECCVDRPGATESESSQNENTTARSYDNSHHCEKITSLIVVRQGDMSSAQDL